MTAWKAGRTGLWTGVAEPAGTTATGTRASVTRIHEAALRLFADKGFHATGIREIGAHAGLHSSVLYHYVRSKDDLLYQLMADGVERYRRTIVRSLDEAVLPEERLTALVATQVIVNARQRRIAKMLATELESLPPERRRKILQITADAERLWDETIQAGIDEGVFDLDAPQMARLALLRMAAGVNQWYSQSGRLSIEEIARVFSDLALKLVGAMRDGRPVRVGGLERPDIARLAAIVAEEHAESPETTGE